jgi:hypothetical protein
MSGKVSANMMTPIRVITAGLPPLQEDLVRRILLAESDLSVVGAVSSASAMSTLVRWHKADVIVVWAGVGHVVSAAIGMLPNYPTLSVVVLAGHGDALVEARVVGGSEDSWPEGLIEAVRRAADRVRSPNGDRGKEL